MALLGGAVLNVWFEITPSLKWLRSPFLKLLILLEKKKSF